MLNVFSKAAEGREGERRGREGGIEKEIDSLFVGCLTSQQHAKCVSGTDLLKQVSVLSH